MDILNILLVATPFDLSGANPPGNVAGGPFCVEAMSIYIPGADKASVYVPGSEKSGVYVPGAEVMGVACDGC